MKDVNPIGRLPRSAMLCMAEVARKSGDVELEQVLRIDEVLEPVRAQVPNGHAIGQPSLHERASAFRDDDLSAVGGRGDARRAMDVESDVIPAFDASLSCKQAYPHADDDAVRPGCLGEPLLGLYGRRDGRRRVPERHEEGVALGPLFHAGVTLKGGPKDSAMDASTSGQASPSASTRWVDPSMSVNRKVTVPEGSVCAPDAIGRIIDSASTVLTRWSRSLPATRASGPAKDQRIEAAREADVPIAQFPRDGASGARTVGEAMMPPSCIRIFAAARPACLFSQLSSGSQRS